MSYSDDDFVEWIFKEENGIIKRSIEKRKTNIQVPDLVSSPMSLALGLCMFQLLLSCHWIFFWEIGAVSDLWILFLVIVVVVMVFNGSFILVQWPASALYQSGYIFHLFPITQMAFFFFFFYSIIVSLLLWRRILLVV